MWNDFDGFYLESAIKKANANVNILLKYQNKDFDEDHFKLFIVIHLMQYINIESIIAEKVAPRVKYEHNDNYTATGHIGIFYTDKLKNSYKIELKVLTCDDLKDGKLNYESGRCQTHKYEKYKINTPNELADFALRQAKSYYTAGIPCSLVLNCKEEKIIFKCVLGEPPKKTLSKFEYNGYCLPDYEKFIRQLKLVEQQTESVNLKNKVNDILKFVEKESRFEDNEIKKDEG